MTIDEYAAWAATLRGPGGGSSAIPPEQSLYLAYLGLGLAGEAGEVVEHVKKLLRDGRWEPERVAEELGDLVYYWACLCAAAGCTPSEVLERSARKIADRTGAAPPAAQRVSAASRVPEAAAGGVPAPGPSGSTGRPSTSSS
jgi:NTP pyrophosphatase (non-canonical NTP hydrolase)